MVKMTGVWDRTSDLLNERSGAVLGIAAGLIFVPDLVSGLLEGVAPANSPGALAAGVASLATTIVALFGGLAITALAIGDAPTRAAIGLAARRLVPVIGVLVLLLAVLLVLMVPFALIALAAGADLATLSGTGTMPELGFGPAAGILVYGVLLMALLVWTAARLAVLTPVILAERNGMGAIGRAWRLTRGHGWALVGVLLLYVFVALVLTTGIGAASGAIGALAGGTQPGFSAARLIPAGAMAIVSTLLSVVQSAFVGTLYRALAPAAELRETFA